MTKRFIYFFLPASLFRNSAQHHKSVVRLSPSPADASLGADCEQNHTVFVNKMNHIRANTTGTTSVLTFTAMY